MNKWIVLSIKKLAVYDADTSGCSAWEGFDWIAGVTTYQAHKLCYNASNDCFFGGGMSDKKEVGRPTVMTPEVVEYICTELAEGRSLRSICREEGMPAVSTVLLAVVQDRNGFSEQYRRAREAAGFAHADNIVELANMVVASEIGPNEARAAMDGLKWAAERMAPKAHSPKQKIDHTTNGESLAPARIEIVAPSLKK